MKAEVTLHSLAFVSLYAWVGNIFKTAEDYNTDPVSFSDSIYDNTYSDYCYTGLLVVPVPQVHWGNTRHLGWA